MHHDQDAVRPLSPATSHHHGRWPLMPSLYDFVGGGAALHRLEDRFYTLVLADHLLQPLFGAGQPHHVDHLTAFTAESFGGPTRFSDEIGFRHLIGVHRGLRITEAQRQRFVQLYLEAFDDVEVTDDPDARAAIEAHVEFGTRVAVQNSHAETDDQLHPLPEVPSWTWARQLDPDK